MSPIKIGHDKSWICHLRTETYKTKLYKTKMFKLRCNKFFKSINRFNNKNRNKYLKNI